MRVVAFDTETELITPVVQVPRLVCVSIHDGNKTELLHFSEAKQRMHELLSKCAEGKLRLVGHNIAFDMAVVARQWPEFLPLIFDCYDAFGVHDTMVRELLRKIAAGEYLQGGNGLKDLASKYQVAELDKTGGARTSYGLVRDTAIDYWPDDMVNYAKEDAIATWKVFMAQEGESVAHAKADMLFANEAMQVQTAFAFQLVTAHGFQVDPDAIVKKKRELILDSNKRFKKMLKDGIVIKNEDTGDEKFSRGALQEIVKEACEEQNYNIRMTKSGLYSTAADDLAELHDKRLQNYLQYKKNEKLLSTFISKLEQHDTVHSSFNILVNTGRCSMRTPNLQQLPREGGIRELFVPSKGYKLAMIDYGAAELRSLAQIMHDLELKSPLIEVMKDPDADPHLALAATMLGITEEEAVRRKKAGDAEVLNYRQSAKAANFGFPGGMGVKRFIATQIAQAKDRDKAVKTFTNTFSKMLRDTWLSKWKMRPYFDVIEEKIEKPFIFQMRSGRLRGGTSYCDGANTLFQGLTADGAKYAVYEAVKEMYVKPESPLFNSRMVNFVHDEIIAEVPEGNEHAATTRLGEIMVDCMATFTPNILPVVEPALAERWYKGAKPVYDKKGKLQIWQPT